MFKPKPNGRPSLGGVQKPAKKKQKEARAKTARSATSVLTSGTLRDALRHHAFERCRHFFLFITTLKTLALWHNAKNLQKLKPLAMYKPHATHQIDDGYRGSATEHATFDKSKASVLDSVATSSTAVDAAHFCNLGVSPTLAGEIDARDRMEVDLLQRLKTYAGNTKWLPQRINIGPDKVIDALHGSLAQQILSTDGPVCTPKWISVYLTEATRLLALYARAQKKSQGIVDSVGCYLRAYLDPVYDDIEFDLPADPRLLGRGVAAWGIKDVIFSQIEDETMGICQTLQMEYNARRRAWALGEATKNQQPAPDESSFAVTREDVMWLAGQVISRT